MRVEKSSLFAVALGFAGCGVQPADQIQVWSSTPADGNTTNAYAYASHTAYRHSISIRAENALVSDLLARISQFEGWSLAFTPQRGLVICTVRLDDVEPISAIESILDVHDMRAVLSNGQLRVMCLTEEEIRAKEVAEEINSRRQALSATRAPPPTVSVEQMGKWPQDLPAELLTLSATMVDTNLVYESLFLKSVSATDMTARLLPLVRVNLGETVTAFPSRRAIVIRATPSNRVRLKRICEYLDDPRWEAQDDVSARTHRGARSASTVSAGTAEP